MSRTGALLLLAAPALYELMFELGLQDVVSVDRRIPFRCAVEVTAVATDSTGPDDAANPANNSVRVEVEVLDQNEL